MGRDVLGVPRFIFLCLSCCSPFYVSMTLTTPPSAMRTAAHTPAGRPSHRRPVGKLALQSQDACDYGPCCAGRIPPPRSRGRQAPARAHHIAAQGHRGCGYCPFHRGWISSEHVIVLCTGGYCPLHRGGGILHHCAFRRSTLLSFPQGVGDAARRLCLPHAFACACARVCVCACVCACECPYVCVFVCVC